MDVETTPDRVVKAVKGVSPLQPSAQVSCSEDDARLAPEKATAITAGPPPDETGSEALLAAGMVMQLESFGRAGTETVLEDAATASPSQLSITRRLSTHTIHLHESESGKAMMDWNMAREHALQKVSHVCPS